jgi:hypothetical protein
MPAIQIRVIYIGGEQKDVRITPRAQIEAEERYSGMNNVSAVRASYWMAWRSLHQAGKESRDYESWLDAIEDAEAKQSLYETVEAALKANDVEETSQAGRILALVKELDDNPGVNELDPQPGEALSPNGSSPSVPAPVSPSLT